MTEREFVMIKPDSVRRKLIGRIITRFEEKGLKLIGMKLITVKKEQAVQLYAEHEGKAFYDGLMAFIGEQPVTALVFSGERAVSITRTLVGATRSYEAAPGTIRGDFATSGSFNVVHASDSTASAEREIAIFFNENELVDYTDPNECFRA